MSFAYTEATFLNANTSLGVAAGDRTLYTPNTTGSVTAEYTIAKFDEAQMTGRVSACRHWETSGR